MFSSTAYTRDLAAASRSLYNLQLGAATRQPPASQASQAKPAKPASHHFSSRSAVWSALVDRELDLLDASAGDQVDDEAFFRGDHSPPTSGGSSDSAIWRNNLGGGASDVDRQALANRSAASCGVPAVVWCGSLMPAHSKGAIFSCKVFLGGIPWDITETDLTVAFSAFGTVRLEWPAPNSHGENGGRNSKGYVYVIFDNERAVKFLLGSCIYDYNHGNHSFYYKVTSSRMRHKEVQVIPWQLANSSYVRTGSHVQMTSNTVFVGSLHGMMTAEGLAQVMEDLFGGVVAACIDTDKYKYPIGSGRVVFNTTSSYIKAIRAAFVELRTQKFSKKIQIDPFLENAMCCICNTEQGPYFCRDVECFKYYCKTCWHWSHSMNRRLASHSPMMRNPRYIDPSVNGAPGLAFTE